MAQDTQSQSFGRELLLAEVSFYNKEKEKYFYEEQENVINIMNIRPEEYKKRRSELLRFTRNELNDHKDDNFIRNSYYCELMDEDDCKDHLSMLKVELESNNITNFLIEFHPGTEENSNHFQYTGNDSIRANELIINYINEKQLSTHFTEKKIEKTIKTEEKKEILESLDDKLKRLEELVKPKKSMADQIKEAKDREVKFKQELEQMKEQSKKQEKEINNVISAIHNARSTRRSRR